ncbi:MAG: hypothetical protein WCU80_07750 [Paludibacteraceae bacterium]|nr:hypothetical protein [Prevotellaceae bacterium]
MSKSQQYELFVEKFKPKLTSDDCYTPAPVYNAVLEWAKGRFPSLEGKNIVAALGGK